jgi:proteasome inhibitor subunit 1 (PI31)
MSSNILDPSAIVGTLPSLLPADSKVLQSPQDALAALLHTALTTLAFRLTSIDDDSSSTSQIASNILPEGWNKNGPSHYTFQYKHDQSSLEFVIKVSKLGTRTVFNAIALEVR